MYSTRSVHTSIVQNRTSLMKFFFPGVCFISVSILVLLVFSSLHLFTCHRRRHRSVFFSRSLYFSLATIYFYFILNFEPLHSRTSHKILQIFAVNSLLYLFCCCCCIYCRCSAIHFINCKISQLQRV